MPAVISTESVASNQMGQLSAAQRASIGRWITARRLRESRALVPLAVVIGLAVLLSQLLGELIGNRGLEQFTARVALGSEVVSVPVVQSIVVLVVAVTALSVVNGLRRMLSFGNAKSSLSGVTQLRQDTGTVVQPGREHVAVLSDGRTWNLQLSSNVCGELRQIGPGAYTFFSLPLRVPATRQKTPLGGDGAWLLAATPIANQTTSSVTSAGSPAPTLLQTLATINHFQLEALPENRAGRLSQEQVQKFAGTFRGNSMRRVLAGLVALVVGLAIWYVTRGQEDSWLALAIAVFGLLVVLFSMGPGRARQSADLADGTVAKYEGAVRPIRVHGADNEGTTHYYDASGIRFDVSESAYEALDERYRYRIYYLPRTTQMVNIEPIGEAPVPAKFDASGGQAPLSASDVGRATGLSVGEPKFRSAGPTGFWTYPAGDDRVTVSIVRTAGVTLLGGPFGMFRRGQPVDGLGDEAFFDGRRMMVRTATALIVIDAPGGQLAVQNLARLAVARLAPG